MSLVFLDSLLNVSLVTGRFTPTDANLKQLVSPLGVSRDYFIENSELTIENKDKIVSLSAELLAEQGNQSFELYSYKRPIKVYQL